MNCGDFKNEIYQFCKLFGLEEDINKKYKYYFKK